MRTVSMYGFFGATLRVAVCHALIACIFNAGNVRAAETPIALRATDGTTKTPLQNLGEPNGTKWAVVIFYLHDCPICNSYAPELERIRGDFQNKGFAFYVVQTDAALTLEAAKKHAAEFKISCPVLLDGTNELARKVGATMTPEVAIVDAAQRVLYLGRIDDLYADYGKRRTEASVHDLRAALDAVYSGKPAPRAAGTAVGCFISFPKK